ncbi:MAG: peptide deformylase [Candidatus Firestonebacteria bacterium]
MKIVKYGDPVLRKKAERIVKIDERVSKLAEAMVSVLHAVKGIGLAANQVGIPEKLCVIDTGRGERKGEVLYLVNPEIGVSEGNAKFEEGCLSFPEIYAEIERPSKVTVYYKDLKGKDKELTAEGILARVLQHEIDHLNGVLFVDHMSKIKYLLLSKRLKALEKETRGK